MLYAIPTAPAMETTAALYAGRAQRLGKVAIDSFYRVAGRQSLATIERFSEALGQCRAQTVLTGLSWRRPWRSNRAAFAMQFGN